MKEKNCPMCVMLVDMMSKHNAEEHTPKDNPKLKALEKAEEEKD